MGRNGLSQRRHRDHDGFQKSTPLDHCRGFRIGGTPPLDLNKVADVLQLECDHCYVAFEAFQALIGEQVEAITKFETKNASKTKAV